ncbi:MAG: flagellar hook assembly protein FlgD [Bdellovibrionales bacterium]|nr:flagellar hook assembly protein FlgD [Bdellovibrionales bacterium]
MAMDINKVPAPAIANNTANTNFGPKTGPTEAEERSQAERNAVNAIQARYGEKPKEGRQIKKTLDKDDFMRIMISEMKHQDPTKPMDADKMATQMAQLTTVEQIKNMGAAIDRMGERNQASDRMAMSSMIGKEVTVDKGRFTHQKGTIAPVTFDLPEDAEKVKLTFMNERGEDVASHDLEPMKAGPNSYNWDGVNASNIPSPSGTYMVRVEAENKQGGRIAVNPISKETIVGVSFEGGEANFLVGDAKNPQRVAFKSVTRIEGDGATRAQAKDRKVQNMEAAGAEAAKSNQAFELPEGLKEKFKDQLTPAAGDVAKADGAGESETPVKAEGFANGLAE